MLKSFLKEVHLWSLICVISGAIDRDALKDPLPIDVLVMLACFFLLCSGGFALLQMVISGRREDNRQPRLLRRPFMRFLKHARAYGGLYTACSYSGMLVCSAGVGYICSALAAPWLSERLEPIRYLSFIVELLFFLITVLLIGFFLLRLTGFDPFDTSMKPAHSETELRRLMQESHQLGLIDQTELTFVDNIFQFSETTAREIMIPRTEMICLRAGLSLGANMTIAIQYMRTRYPVCENDKDNIIGFVHIKDLLKKDMSKETGIAELIRPVTTVPESISISILLKVMQKKRSQIAILIDEYGGTSGLVTLEDIMEEIVGDIQDEFDPDMKHITLHADGSYSVNGQILIEEVNSYFGLGISTDDYDTLGGWLGAHLEGSAMVGQMADFGWPWQFQIEEIKQLRIARARLIPAQGAIDSEHENKLNKALKLPD